MDCNYKKLKKDSGYSPALIAFVEKCMTADPKKRPSVEDCLTMVGPILAVQMDSLKKKVEGYETLEEEVKELRETNRG